MPVGPLLAILALILLANLAYPLVQAAMLGGIVYYTNANDEATYLQYDFARAALSWNRPGQLLVVWAHELGISGGWQNLLADLATPLLFTAGAFLTFRRLGFEAPRARLAALAALALPLVFSGVDPLMRKLGYLNVAWGSVYWINTVMNAAPGLLRTPEPQASWLVLALAVGLCLGRAWPVLVAVPFMYVFVGVPAAFVAGAWELRRAWRERPGATVGPLLLAWLGLGVVSALYYQHGMSPAVKALVTPTRLPLFSVSAALALAAWAFVRAGLPPRSRFPALAVALAPLAGANLQVVSGYIAQPFNFEEYAGTMAIALVLILGATARPRTYRALVAAGCALWVWAGVASYRQNALVNGLVPFDARLATALHEDPRHTAVADRDLASALVLVYPREATTALAFDQGCTAVAARYVGTYRCARRRILADFPMEWRFFRAILFLDNLYTYGGQDFIMLHLGRPHVLVPQFDVEKGGCDPADDLPLRYFPVPPARASS